MWDGSCREAGAKTMADGTEFLSARECEVLYWVAYGKTSWEISRILKVSERTINFHVAKCIRKLNAANRSHAAVKAVQIGAITV